MNGSLVLNLLDTGSNQRTISQSLQCAEHEGWKRAGAAEREALHARGVMSVVPTPVGVKPIKSRYVFKRKYKKDGTIRKYKARLVALRYGQVPGVDVFNAFAPVVKSITVRLLLVLAFVFDMRVHQLDVSNAFCYADIEGDVYMEASPDFDLQPDHCFKLAKSLYGLRSSPRSWWKHLNKYIKSLLFMPCILEPCLYYTTYKGKRMYLSIYVDDILLACKNITYIN